jgi:hypothetical protein
METDRKEKERERGKGGLAIFSRHGIYLTIFSIFLPA